MSALELRAVRKSYGQVAAVDHIDLVVPNGSRMAIVGPSGSGKTTLLRLIAGFEVPDAGTILLDGETLADERRAVPAHKRNIGYLPQDGALFPHLTVENNIAFGLAGSVGERVRRVTELMDMVALDRAMRGRWPHEISGGQQQRVALARALAQRPRLMLLDEPFSALDAGLRAATRKAVGKLLDAAGVTTVLVTHDQAEALSFADRIAVIREGGLAQIGSPQDLYLRPRDEATALFLGDAVILPAWLGGGWANCRLGRIAVDDPERLGPGRVMLRPEQLQAEKIEGRDINSAACVGTVTEIDFGGHLCLLAVTPTCIDGKEEETPPDSLLVRCPLIRAPAVGDTVSITVLGAAHVFEAP